MNHRSPLALAILATIVTSTGCGKPAASTEDSSGAPAVKAASTTPTAPATPRAVFGMPPGWELVPSATYTARQSAGTVTIKATGQHNTGGYQTKLVESPLRIYPPQWMLAQKAPDGPATQAITPFEASASFKADEPIKSIRVSDAAGQHDVNVERGD